MKVIAVDNYITGKKENIQHLLSHPNFKLYEKNISEPFEIIDELDYILHFASPASPKEYLKYPIETLQVNSIGTENLLKLAKKNNARILLASTSEIYGDPLIHPQIEEYYGNVNSFGPRAVYDEAKRYLEAISMAYRDLYDTDIRIVRIFNTYGPRMDVNDGRVIPNFINQLLCGKNVTVYGDGSQTRSFCYVDDLIEGVFRLLMSDYTSPINIGNDAEITIEQFAKELMKIMNTNGSIIYSELPQNDPLKRKPDLTKAKSILKWQPTTSIDEGLRRTIEWFKK
jgi:dTDP-glucose 4,6-dehydratase